MPGILIVRVDAQLYYANAVTVRNDVKAMVAGTEAPPHAVIFDADAQDDLDVTSIDVLRALLKDLRHRDIDVYVAHLHAPLRVRAHDTGLLDVIGEDHVFANIEAAVQHAAASQSVAAP